MSKEPQHQARRQLGEQVRALRLDRRLSQEALADAASLHRTYVGAVERGERNVSLDQIARLATALDVPVATLFPHNSPG